MNDKAEYERVKKLERIDEEYLLALEGKDYTMALRMNSLIDAVEELQVMLLDHRLHDSRIQNGIMDRMDERRYSIRELRDRFEQWPESIDVYTPNFLDWLEENP